MTTNEGFSEEVNLTELWGPAPSKDEYIRALAWNDQEFLRRLGMTVEGYLMPQHAAELLGISFEEVNAKIDKKHLIAADLGDAGRFLPDWQFVDQGEKMPKASHPKILELWQLWHETHGRGLDFCEFMQELTIPSYPESPLEIVLKADDAHAVQEVEQTIMYRHVSP